MGGKAEMFVSTPNNSGKSLRQTGHKLKNINLTVSLREYRKVENGHVEWKITDEGNLYALDEAREILDKLNNQDNKYGWTIKV